MTFTTTVVGSFPRTRDLIEATKKHTAGQLPKEELDALEEKAAAARDEIKSKRYAVVGDLAIKAVEQAIEAAASTEGIHFHTQPRRAHSERLLWAKQKFEGISKDLDELWGAYGALGYEGVDGERGRKVLEAMEKVIERIGEDTKLGLE